MQDQFAKFASRSFAAAGHGDAVGVLANEGGGIGDCHAQADTTDHG